MVEYTDEQQEVVIDTDGNIATVSETCSMIYEWLNELPNGAIGRSILEGAFRGYLQFALNNKLITAFNIVCDEDNNFEDDKEIFIDVIVALGDPDDEETNISFAFGSDAAIEEWVNGSED